MSADTAPDHSLLDVVVHARVDEADGIVVLTLRAADGGVLPTFEPGAHIDVHLGPSLIRQYSLCNDPADCSHYAIGVLRDPATRGGSAAVHALQPGQALRISAPRNAFALRPGRARKLLVAGGIGVTPLKAMMHRLHAEDVDFTLHYFARSARTAAFRESFALAPFAAKVVFHFDDAGGRLPLPVEDLDPARTPELYVCGPAGFIAAVREQALAAGYSPDAIHVEHFAPVGASAAADNGSFTVDAVRSGLSVTVAAEQTIAQALEAAGVMVLTSCEQGMCGVCLTPVLDGLPDHRDEFQTDEEKAANDKITICCSRARTPVLRLDI